MNNFMISLKRFFTNKNTVTIIGVIIVLGILYWGYSSTINSAVNPVRVPVAANTIDPQTEITKSDINWIEVPSISKNTNVLTREADIVGKYTGVNATIPEGSMFYSDVLVSAEELPGNWLTLLTTDEIPTYLSASVVTTYGNSIQPGTFIDVYMKAENEAGLVMYGKLIENIEIKAVKDSSGEDVFKSQQSVGTPAYMYFGLENEFYILIQKTKYMSTNDVEIVVVPHGGAVPVTGDVEVSSEYLRDYIDANTLTIPENSENTNPVVVE